MSHSFSQAAQQKGAATSELDEVKRMLIETNPILLIVTAIVSALHMVFEFLGKSFLQMMTSWADVHTITFSLHVRRFALAEKGRVDGCLNAVCPMHL